MAFRLSPDRRPAQAASKLCSRWRCVIVCGCLVVTSPVGCGDGSDDATPDAAPSLSQTLGGGEASGFARAIGPRHWRFPRDHGPHPDYRTEWWYLTGNLDDAAGRRYGFQLTFFRTGLAPGAPERPARWATRSVWMAHFAITDVAAERFVFRERFARGGAMGLAGAERDPVHVWLEDWRLRRRPAGAWRLTAATEAMRLVLTLDPRKPPVRNGERGLSRKGPEPGQASYYYAIPRLQAKGWLHRGKRRAAVTGRAWLDREWSTGSLPEATAGWDWFALQLDDGTDVMIYRLRPTGGGTSRFSAATITDADGTARHLETDEFSVTVTDHWTRADGTRYPSSWRIDVATDERTLHVRPVLADQAVDASVRYWEGAVDVRAGGDAVGRGYVELTGYATAD